MDARLTEELNDMHGYITSELHAGERGRVIWEVYGGQRSKPNGPDRRNLGCHCDDLLT